MLILRSIAFQICFYLNLILQLLIFLPVFFFISEKQAWTIVKNMARSSLWILKVVAGTDSTVEGQENLPKGGCIVASKHQSFWEIIALLPQLESPTFILKKELMSIPVFGQYAKRMKMIPIDRSKRGGAIPAMLEEAKRAVGQGRQIVIFPEGTRVAPGAAPDYRQGVYRLYEALDLPVVPVALNSGLYWPRKDVRRWPGTIRAELLPPLQPGLSRTDFLAHLREAIETRSKALLDEAERVDGLRPRPLRRTADEAERPS